ncbi:MAG: phosphate starvation-inducible protein PhoH, partial [Burkholderiales bacterium PBB5]
MIVRHHFEPTDNTRLAHLSGAFDAHLRSIEAALGVRISRRGGAFSVEGARGVAEPALNLLVSLYERAARPSAPEVLQLALVELRSQAAGADDGAPVTPGADAITLHTRRHDLRGRTP